MDSFTSEISWYYWLLVAAVVGMLTVKFLFGKKANLPPSPGALPIIGSFPFMDAKPDEPAHQMFGRLGEKFGPLVYLRIGSNPTIIISDGDVAKLVLKDLDYVFASRPYLSAGKYMGMDFQAVSFAPNGPYCTRIRKIYTKELLGPQKVSDGHVARERAVFYTLGVVHQMQTEGQVVNLTSLLKDLCLNMSMGMVFGWKDGKLHKSVGTVKQAHLKAVVEEAVRRASEFNFGDSITVARWLDVQGVIGRMRKLAKEMKAIAIALIEEYESSSRKSPHAPDATILDTLLSLEGADKLSPTAMSGVMYDLIMAGSDTASASSDWTIAELMKEPKLVNKLRAELDSVVGKDRFVTEAHIPRLPYLQAVVKESLRLHPPTTLGVPHYSMADCKLAGYDIPAGTTAILNLWAINRDPKRWPEPRRFDPDRFFMQEKDMSLFGSTYHLLPFSSGRRGCPGMLLGLTMVQIIVANFMHAFDFQAAGELTSNDDIDVLDERPGIVSMRSQDLSVRAFPRLNSKLYEEFSPQL